MTHDEQMKLLKEGKILYGTAYPEWCGMYCGLDDSGELIWNEVGYNGRLLPSHYEITVLEKGQRFSTADFKMET